MQALVRACLRSEGGGNSTGRPWVAGGWGEGRGVASPGGRRG